MKRRQVKKQSQTMKHSQLKSRIARLQLPLLVFINKLKRRPQYVIYTFFGLVVIVSGMIAFWPEKSEKFGTYTPKEKEQAQELKQELFFEPVKIYGTGTVKKPVSVFVDEKNVYVSDIATNTVKIYYRDGKTLAVIKGTGKSQKEILDYPNGIAPLQEDKLLITESGGKKLIVYKRDSAYIRVIENTDVLKPGYAVAQDDKIYIADLEAHDIKVMDTNGKIVSSIATPLNKNLLLKYPQGMDFDKDGNLWIADGGNERIVAFDKEGNYLKSFRGSESGGTPFSMVKGLAILKGRYIAVSDPIINKIRVFDLQKDLKEVAAFGGTGKEKGKFVYPMGLFSDSNEHLFVADRGNSRVQEFAIK